MVKAEDLVGKSYGEANALTGLEFNLRDHNTDHHLIQDLAQAETYLGIAEAFLPEYNPKVKTGTQTERFSRLRNLSDYVSSRFNNLKHTKTAAALTAAGMISAATFGALTKDLGVELPDIVMDASAQDEPIIIINNDIGNPNLTKLHLNNSASGIYYARISEDNLAMFADSQVILYNLNSGQQEIFAKDYGGAIKLINAMDISSNYLVYINQSSDGSNEDTILAYDLKTNTLSTVHQSNFINNIQISENNLIWRQQSTNDLYATDCESDILLKNLNTKATLNLSQVLNKKISDPSLDSNKVVYNGCQNETRDVYLYDLITKKENKISPLTDENTRNAYPIISKNNVVWSCLGECERGEGIYIYNISQNKISHIISPSDVLFKTRLDDIIMNNIALILPTEDEIAIYYITANSTKVIETSYPLSIDISQDKLVWTNGLSAEEAGLYLFDLNAVAISKNPSELDILVRQHAPTYVFSAEEPYFPIDPYADGDKDVSNNRDNYRNGKFPMTPTIFYTITDYSQEISTEHPEGFIVIQYWDHYAYNDAYIKHKLDWEAIHKWVDKKTGEVFYTSASMHFWNNKYDGDVNGFLVEKGSHGKSNDKFMYNNIKMIFVEGGITLASNHYNLQTLDDLAIHSSSNFPGERGKFPTEQDRYKDPDKAIRQNNISVEIAEIQVNDSPELRVIDSKNRVTGLVNGIIKEDIPNSAYIGLEERAIVLSNKNIRAELKGIKDENYTIKITLVDGTSEQITEKDAEIKTDDIQHYTFDFQNNINTTNPQDTNKDKKISFMQIPLAAAAIATAARLRKKWKKN